MSDRDSSLPCASTQRIPMVDLTAQYAGIRAEVDAALARVVDSGRFVGGSEVEAFEGAIAAMCEVPYAVGCGSGSDAILLALMAHGVGPGDQVVCPATTFFSTASGISRLGATPVFADIDPESFCLSARSAEEAIARAGPASAIVAVHLYGRAAPLRELEVLAGRLGIPLIEDLAQAVGARDADGRACGSVGAASALSFYPTKNLGAFGDAGMVLTADARRAEQLRALRIHGETGPGEYTLLGINSRLDALQAAVLGTKLSHLEAWTAARRSHALRYDALLAEAGAAPGPGDFRDLRLPVRLPRPPATPAAHVHHHYVIRVPAEERDPLRRHLEAAGIATGVYYSKPLHRQPVFRPDAGTPPELPVAEALAREGLAIPVHAELQPDQIPSVVDSIRLYFSRA